MSEQDREQGGKQGGVGPAATRFRKGESGNPAGRPKQPDFPLPEVPGWEHADDLLRDIRWAYRNLGRRCEATAAQAQLRKLFETDRAKFLDLKVKLEAAYREEYPVERGPAGGGVSVPTAPEEVDEGTARCLELAERVLKELTGGG